MNVMNDVHSNPSYTQCTTTLLWFTHFLSLPFIIFFLLLLVLWFIREILFPSASTSFFSTAFTVVIVYVSNSFFWCNAYISFFSIFFYTQWGMSMMNAKRKSTESNFHSSLIKFYIETRHIQPKKVHVHIKCVIILCDWLETKDDKFSSLEMFTFVLN